VVIADASVICCFFRRGIMSVATASVPMGTVARAVLFRSTIDVCILCLSGMELRQAVAANEPTIGETTSGMAVWFAVI
jgi:hypothetical protein